MGVASGCRSIRLAAPNGQHPQHPQLVGFLMASSTVCGEYPGALNVII
jgi:hypothetical protein